MTAMLQEVLDEVFPANTDLPLCYYGEPANNSELPEPDVPVGDSVLDRDGFPWFRTVFGWQVAGDGRCQPWDQVRRWF